jgi:hypothetical protein
MVERVAMVPKHVDGGVIVEMSQNVEMFTVKNTIVFLGLEDLVVFGLFVEEISEAGHDVC